MSNASAVRSELDRNEHFVYVFSADDLIDFAKNYREDIIQVAETSALTIPLALDLMKVAELLKEFGLKESFYIKDVNGVKYVIFKGYAGLREIFTGTTYSVNNAKILNMAVGTNGVKQFIKSGARFSIYFTIPITVLEVILSDQNTLFHLFGSITTDLVKIGISSIIASAAAVAVASVTTVAVGPVVVAIAVGLATAFALDYIDKQLGLTDKLVQAMESNFDKLAEAYERAAQAADRASRRAAWSFDRGVKEMFCAMSPRQCHLTQYW